MTSLLKRYDDIVAMLDTKLAPWLMPTLARAVFAAVFFYYYWNSAGTKLDGPFSPTAGAFGQIFPKAAEAVLWDISQASFLQKAIMVLGAWAEYILPVLILIGLLTRFAALGMIGFVIVQSYVDVTGHGVKLGGWFDNVASGTIMDERTVWILLYVYMVFRGAGPISVDFGLSKLRDGSPSPQTAE